MSINEYIPKNIEGKWQEFWESKRVFKAEDFSSKPKFYALIEFPYPSGEGLHVGHPRPYTALDVIARKKRLQGFNVLYPIGWDAFGLPTENYAIKTKIHPKIVTKNNIARFKQQCKSLGFSFDWDREVNTTSTSYYKWTQWIFLKLFEKGLAYKSEMPINWCTSCKVGLANEEVVNGLCERCGGEVVRKQKSQWMLKITEYAEKLLNDLSLVDYIEKAKVQQINWIGRSEGMEVDFGIEGSNEKIRIFTTRPDTIFGATYMVLSPEHHIINQLIGKIQNINQVKDYQIQATKKSDFERTEMANDKTGVLLDGVHAINPLNNTKIPIYISDYVLITYGTGAIMAVPAHDTRDFEFAKKFNLPIVEVVSGGKNMNEEAYTETETGILVNSEFLNGLEVKAAKKVISDYIEEKGYGKRKVNYKLRDWVFSRQRYWGEPIPLVYCEKCGWVPVPEHELPLTLPEIENFMPTNDGESPLARAEEWINTKCPKCEGPGRRETDTMPQWAGSSWYFLRYIDPLNENCFADAEKLKYWLPIDWYNGGMEHTTLHLLYSRFWHKFLYDLGLVPTPEPYNKRTSHGMILGENNEKMSKSRGNVVNPDHIINEFGADTFRLYEMFLGAFDQSAAWSKDGVRGARRFLDRVWKLQQIVINKDEYSSELESLAHKTIKKVTTDYEEMKYNTAIAAMMSLVNEFYKIGKVTYKELSTLLILLNPVAPHITEELWQQLKLGSNVCYQKWPEWDEAKILSDNVEIGVQVNGKLKGVANIPLDATKEVAKEIILGAQGISKHIDGKMIVKEIYVPNKIFNFIVK